MIVTENTLTLTEGEVKHVDVILTLPPKFICNRTGFPDDTDCDLQITSQITNTDDINCFEGNQHVPQAVIGYSPMDLDSSFKSVSKNQFVIS